MTYETVQVRELEGGCGAEVLGLDLTAMSNRQWDEVQRAFVEHGVIFFRDQTLTPEQHLAFGKRWGTLNVHPYVKGMAGYPEILEIIKRGPMDVGLGVRK